VLAYQTGLFEKPNFGCRLVPQGAPTDPAVIAQRHRRRP
jgi:hypothetical protein